MINRSFLVFQSICCLFRVPNYVPIVKYISNNVKRKIKRIIYSNLYEKKNYIILNQILNLEGNNANNKGTDIYIRLICVP